MFGTEKKTKEKRIIVKPIDIGCFSILILIGAAVVYEGENVGTTFATFVIFLSLGIIFLYGEDESYLYYGAGETKQQEIARINLQARQRQSRIWARRIGWPILVLAGSYNFYYCSF